MFKRIAESVKSTELSPIVAVCRDRHTQQATSDIQYLACIFLADEQISSTPYFKGQFYTQNNSGGLTRVDDTFEYDVILESGDANLLIPGTYYAAIRKGFGLDPITSEPILYFITVTYDAILNNFINTETGNPAIVQGTYGFLKWGISGPLVIPETGEYELIASVYVRCEIFGDAATFAEYRSIGTVFFSNGIDNLGFDTLRYPVLPFGTLRLMGSLGLLPALPTGWTYRDTDSVCIVRQYQFQKGDTFNVCIQNELFAIDSVSGSIVEYAGDISMKRIS